MRWPRTAQAENGGYDRVLYWDSRHSRWCLALTFFRFRSNQNVIVKKCFVLPIVENSGSGTTDGSVEDPRSRSQRGDIDALRHCHDRLLSSAVATGTRGDCHWHTCDALGFDFVPVGSGTSAVKSVQITELGRQEADRLLGKWGVRRDWNDHSFHTSGSSGTETVEAYLKRVGLDAWTPHFKAHLPAKMRSVSLVRSTTAADLRRMAKVANMRLDEPTISKVLGALAKN